MIRKRLCRCFCHLSRFVSTTPEDDADDGGGGGWRRSFLVGIEFGPVNHVLPGHLGLDALLHTALAHRRIVVDLRHHHLAPLLRLAVPVAPLGGAREVVPAGVVASVPLAHDGRRGAVGGGGGGE